MEEKVKRIRKELIEKIKNEKVNFFEWERIRDYVDEMFEQLKKESTL